MAKLLMYDLVSEDKARVTSIIHDISGLSSDVLAKGIMVDFLPEPENKGKIAIMIYKPSTGEVYYEYTDPQPQPEIEQLKAQNAAMLLALINGGLM